MAPHGTGRASGWGVNWIAAATVGLGMYALAIAWTGGFDLRLGGARLRSTAWERPALAAAAGAAWLLYAARRQLATRWRRAVDVTEPRLLAGGAAAWAIAVGLLFGTFASGGADSYGYVGQAQLMLKGRLTDAIPLRAGFNWPDAEPTLIPLGFTGGQAPGVIAPKYPPGLPLLMTPLAALSEHAIYLLVPLFGALAVWLVYRLGAEVGDPAAGAMAAMLLAVSPPFLYQLVQPMSDVPGLACWLGALVVAARGTAVSAGIAGAITALAVAVRPNLGPLAAVILMAAVLSTATGRWRRAAAFAAGLAPGIVALAWVQDVRYGSPFSSGYGTVADGFGVQNIRPNLARYPQWLTETHTPFIWLAALAPAWIRGHARNRLLASTAVLLACGVWAAYLPYTYFQSHEWFYTRFLLPAIAVMLFFASAVTLSIVRRLPGHLRAPATCAIAAALLVTSLLSGEARSAFGLHRLERKYPAAGSFAREHLPATAFILAGQHSGSLRYYAGRPTLRWDLLGASHLDQALDALRAEGFEPFAVLDADEDEAFRRKFEGAGQRGAARLVPLALLGSARVYGFRR